MAQQPVAFEVVFKAHVDQQLREQISHNCAVRGMVVEGKNSDTILVTVFRESKMDGLKEVLDDWSLRGCIAYSLVGDEDK